jgi:ABC-type protease/lipase transport system fused ATPase/permease subunit
VIWLAIYWINEKIGTSVKDMKNIVQVFRELESNKIYVVYAIGYGLSSLIVPLGLQFLINSLALSGIWLNISAFIAFVIIGVAISHFIKHSQFILIESMNREIFCSEMKNWTKFKNSSFSHYYFEVLNLLKSFSKAYASLIELFLVTVFGLLTVILFHPFFFILALIIISAVYYIFKFSYESALAASIKESDQKYNIFDIIKSENEVTEGDLKLFLKARDEHFNHLRQKSFTVTTLMIVVQSLLLSIGCYLIHINQLSIGQLVSAEIIISGIFIPLSKLPSIIEAIYDYETSKYKIKKALGGQYES